MIEMLRPWLGLALGIVLIWNGARMAGRPQAYIGVGLPPARDPRTVRIFGIASITVGVLLVLLNLIYFASE